MPDATPDRNLAELLQALEERLMDPSVRADRSLVASLLHEDFIEFGSSGKMYDREAIIEALHNEQRDEPDREVLLIADFALQLLAPHIALVTYRATRRKGARVEESLRSSIWQLQADTWRVRFHQGTRVA